MSIVGFVTDELAIGRTLDHLGLGTVASNRLDSSRDVRMISNGRRFAAREVLPL
jgi:hypothetical protein